MAFSKEARKTSNLLGTLLIGGAISWYGFTKSKDWRIILGIAALGFIIAYAFTTQVTRAIYNSTNRPDDIQLPGGGTTASSTPGFDAKPWVERLYRDLYGISWFFSRDSSLWAELTKLRDGDLVQIGNLWKNMYYNEEKETLPQAIDDDHFTGNDYINAKSVNDRLKALGFI